MEQVQSLDEDGTELGGIEVFPNPASERINISSNLRANIKSAELIDLTGKLISYKYFGQTNGAYLLPLKNIEKGTYFLKVEMDQGVTKTFKVLVER